MAARKVQLKDNSGNKAYPVTSSECVGMSDGSGNLDNHINKITTEYNVSLFHPTDGVDGGNKYTLETAIAKVGEELRHAGLKVTFLNEEGTTETWEYRGGSFTSSSSWEQIGAGRIEELQRLGSNLSAGKIDKKTFYVTETETKDCAISSSYTAFYFLQNKVVTNQTYIIAIKFGNKPSGGTVYIINKDSDYSISSESIEVGKEYYFENTIRSGNRVELRVQGTVAESVSITVSCIYQDNILYTTKDDVTEQFDDYDSRYIDTRKIITLDGYWINTGKLTKYAPWITKAIYIDDSISELIIDGTSESNRYFLASSDSIVEGSAITPLNVRGTYYDRICYNVDIEQLKGKYVLLSKPKEGDYTLDVLSFITNRFSSDVAGHASDSYKSYLYYTSEAKIEAPISEIIDSHKLKITWNSDKATFVLPVSNKGINVKADRKYRVFFKIKPTFMNVEKLRFQTSRGSINNREIFEINYNDINKELYFLSEKESYPSSNNSKILWLNFNNTTLDGDPSGKASCVTNDTKNTRIDDSDNRYCEFEIYDVQLIDCSYTKNGKLLATNCISQLFEQLKTNYLKDIPIRSEHLANKVINIKAEGDSMTWSSIWADSYLFIPYTKFNLEKGNRNQGHISNKTINSVPSTSYTAGFVDRVVKGEITFENCNVGIIQLGIHDYGQNAQGNGYCKLGEVGKLIDTDPNYPDKQVYDMFTVAGAIETVLKTLSAKYPNVFFFWIPVAYNKYLTSYVDYTLQQENYVIRKACERWGTPVVDIDKIGINESNISGLQLWDGIYEDNKRIGESGELIDNEDYFVTSFINIGDIRVLCTNAVNNYYYSAYADDTFIRNNNYKWGIVPTNTTRVRLSVPKEGSVELESAISNNPNQLVIADLATSYTTDRVHLPYAQDRYAKAVASCLDKYLP